MRRGALHWGSWVLGFFLLACALAYGLVQARFLLVGPTLSIASPKSGSALYEPLVKVEGTAEHTASLLVGGRPVLPRPDGTFSEPLLLAPGYNEITLVARDRFGKERETTLELVYEPDNEEAVVQAPSTPSS